MVTQTASPKLNRRSFLTGAAALAAASALPGPAGAATGRITRKIPSSGKTIPVIGMGTWITFNVGRVPALLDARARVLDAFFAAGGGMIDSSPMYGSAEAVVGHGLKKDRPAENLFSASKVWTSSAGEGRQQIADSYRLWGLDKFDLMQVHNLVAWQEHLKTLRGLKEAGKLRYIGITTSHGWRHSRMAAIMRSEPLDFIQLTYNITDRDAESRLLPLAQEKGIAVIANRPFRRGSLVDRLEGEKLPPWAAEFGARTWPQFLLKFIVSHPAITCTIPATSRVDHMRENMAAGAGPLPDAKTRQRMIRYVQDL